MPAETSLPILALPFPSTVAVPADDPMHGFAQHLHTLPGHDVRRLGLALAQSGLLVTVGGFCVSIAAMNIGLAATLAGCLLAGAPLHRCVGAGWYVALVAWFALSSLQAWQTKELISTAAVPLGLLVAQVAFHPAMPHAERVLRWVVRLLVIGITVGTLVCLAQFLIGRGDVLPFGIDPDGPRFERASGLLGQGHTHGLVMGVLACLVLTLLARSHPAMRLGTVGLAMLSVAICGARAAMLGFAGAIGAYVMARGGRFLVIGACAVLGGLGAAFMLMWLLWPAHFRLTVAMEDGRWPIWRASVAIVAQQPLLGTGGKRAYQEAYVEAYPRVNPGMASEFPGGARNAHNTLLAHASEHGIPYALCWLVLLLIPLLHVRRADRTLLQAGVGMVVMALVYGLFMKLDGESQRVLWTGLGMLLALRGTAPADGGLQAAPSRWETQMDQPANAG